MAAAVSSAPGSSSYDLVDVDPDAIRPVEKVQASEEHGRALDACLAPRADDAPGTTKLPLASPLDAFILDDVLSAEECAALRRCAEAAEYSFWNASTSTATFRNSDTVEITSAAVADELWRRVREHVVPEVVVQPGDRFHEGGLQGVWRACGVNTHLLFNRYKPGGHFSPHTDGATVVDMNHRSLYSMLVYLNRCDVGGGTALFAPPPGTSLGRFIRDEEGGGIYRWPAEWRVDEAPVEPGTVLVFSQDTPHEGVPVGEGREKIIIRTDVMYRRDPPAFDDDVGREAYRLHREAQTAEAGGDHMAAMRLYRHCRRLCPAYADFVGLG